MSSSRASAWSTVALTICWGSILPNGVQAQQSPGVLSLVATTVSTPQNVAVQLAVARTGGSSGPVSVRCTAINGTAASPQDYAPMQQQLIWRNGNSDLKYCQVTPNDAVPFSGSKTLSVVLSSPTGATLGSATIASVTITGNAGAGTVSMTASAYTVAQNGALQIPVNRTGGSSGPASVTCTAESGTASTPRDYAPVQQRLIWRSGRSDTKYCLVTPNNSVPFLGTRLFSVQLSSASGASLGSVASATVTIAGDSTASPGSFAGFNVSGGQLYDANGNPFRIRGVDRCHWDSPSQPGISNSGANAVRVFMYSLSTGAATYAQVLQTQHIAYNEVPILAMQLFPDGTLTTGNTDPAELNAGVDWWVANAASFTPLNRYLIVNIANEWGPGDSTVWRDSYISAVSQMRAAGYTGALMIDAGGSGQDISGLLAYATAVFDADPENNLIFSLHVYGSIPTASVAADIAQLSALARSAGMAFVIGEFGPGKNIGPSPTLTTPADVITAAEANGIGWMAWAWDDNDLDGGASDDNFFSMTYAGPGIYKQPSDLTLYGQDVVLNPTYGLHVLATPASIF
jgi:mannan endo-1,4-beta-mannosidase